MENRTLIMARTVLLHTIQQVFLLYNLRQLYNDVINWLHNQNSWLK